MNEESYNFSFGLTKEEHDAILSKKNRPLTQPPIQKRNSEQIFPQNQIESVLEQLIRLLSQRKNNDNS